MVVLRSSALKGWSVLTSLLLERVQNVGPVHRGSQKMAKNVKVRHFVDFFSLVFKHQITIKFCPPHSQIKFYAYNGLHL